MKRLAPILFETTASWGLALSDEQLGQFQLYADELRRWNERVNLTAISDPAQIAVRHFLDALRCALVWGDAPASLIDIGTGAGFPGLPLKLLRPALALTLVESVAKKAAFLEHLVAQLGLTDVTIIVGRAEAVGRDPLHRERYDVATARAVAELRVLAEYCLPLCRVGGRFLAPKGERVADEAAQAARAITLLGGALLQVAPVALPGVEPRTIVVVEKVAATPTMYPRGVGIPSRRPL